MISEKISSEKAAFVFLIVLALLVRTWGINFGLPLSLNVDEAHIAQICIDYFSKGLNPHFFHIPTLYTYLVSGTWALYCGLGKIAGRFPTRAEFIAHFNQDPTIFYILGRMLTVFLSVGTVLLVYFIGKRMYSWRLGFLAALFLIFSPEHNKISHYMEPDSPMLFSLALSFIFIWFIYTRGERKFYLLAGLAAGLATATKYGGQILFLPLFLAHTFYILENKLPLRRIIFSSNLVLSVVVFFAAFFAGCPYSILDFPTFWRDFSWQSRHLYTVGHFGDSTADPAWLFYLKYGFRENVGILAQFLVLGGIVLGLARHRKKDLILLSYPLFLFIIIGTWKTRATRYMLPLAPFFILLGALFLDALLSRLQGPSSLLRFRTKIRPAGDKILAAALVILFLLAPAYKVVMFDRTLTQQDTRITAKVWIEKIIPKGSRVALESYCPQLSSEDYELFYRHTLSQVNLEWLTWKKIQYVVTSDAMSARFTRFPKEFPKEAEFYRSLEARAVPVKTFEPAWDEYKNDLPLTDLHNPTIKVYKWTSCPTFLFPGNFALYSQSVALKKADDGSWTLSSFVTGRPLPGLDEQVRNPYVRISDHRGKEISRLEVYPGRLEKESDFSYSGSARLPSWSDDAKVSIGYRYALKTPGLRLPKPEGELAKESTVFEGTVKSDPSQKSFLYLYYYILVPNDRGHAYCQIVSLANKGGLWRLSSTVFGGELRWGDEYVLNPFVQIIDQDGREVQKLVLFEGRVGSWQADRRATVRGSWEIPSLPRPFRIMVGYDAFYNNEKPGRAGGSESFEVRELPPFEGKK
jgi:hypothetical protein